jgi:hypothetical protein
LILESRLEESAKLCASLRNDVEVLTQSKQELQQRLVQTNEIKVCTIGRVKSLSFVDGIDFGFLGS